MKDIREERIRKKRGSNLRRAREKKGMSQYELAEKLRLKDLNYISRVENGNVGLKEKNWYKIAQILGVPDSDLLSLDT